MGENGMVQVVLTKLPVFRFSLKTRQGHYVTMDSGDLPIPQGITVWVPGKEGEPLELEQAQDALRQAYEATIAVMEPIIVQEHVRVETGQMWQDHADETISL